jgi:tetratricopeptide (TPR) repeat protein
MKVPGSRQLRRTAGFALVGLFLIRPVAAGPQTPAEAYAQGRAFYLSGDYAGAERMFKRALALGPETAELHHLLGMCAAFQGRLDEAERSLLAAIRIDPAFVDSHIEIGGLYFNQKRYADSERALRRALKLSPEDAYARDLLGTVYFVNGSQDRALEQWNRIGRPVLDKLLIAGDGIPRTELLRRELRTRPGQLVRPSGIRESLIRLDKVDSFSGVSFDLRPSPDSPERADLLISGREERGFGPGPAATVIGGLRDVLQRTAYLDFKNISHRGVNLSAAYRWDPYQKMRALAVQAPRLFGSPFYYRLGYRDRQERWFFGASDAGGEDEEFTLSVREIRIDLDHVLSHRISLDHHAGIKRAAYLPVSGRANESRETRFVWGGDYAFRLAEVRAAGLTTDVRLSYDLFKPFGAGAKGFLRSVLAATVAKVWTRGVSPEAAGRLTGQVNGGLSSSHTPFDEWFVLGIGPDVEYPLRAFRTKRNGKLGASPVGKKFVLLNVDYLQRLGRLALARFDAGVFFDAGRAFDGQPLAGESPASWMTDCGVRLEARLFRVAFRISYAHSLKDRRQAFYISSSLE